MTGEMTFYEYISIDIKKTHGHLAPPKPLTWNEAFDVGEGLVTAFIRVHKCNIEV